MKDFEVKINDNKGIIRFKRRGKSISILLDNFMFHIQRGTENILDVRFLLGGCASKDTIMGYLKNANSQLKLTEPKLKQISLAISKIKKALRY